MRTKDAVIGLNWSTSALPATASGTWAVGIEGRRQLPSPAGFATAYDVTHLVARAVQFETDDADFIRDARLANVGDDLELLPDLPDQRLLNQPRRIHQPKTPLRR